MAGWERVHHQVAIAGRVSETRTGRAIGGALVEITAGPPAFTAWLALQVRQYGAAWDRMIERPDRTRTAADGHFHFMDLPAGLYTLTAFRPGFGARYGSPQPAAVMVPPADSGGHITLQLADLALPPTTLSGQVADEGGEPLLMAQVRVQGSGEQTLSDGAGQYRLTGLEATDQLARPILVTAPGYRPVSKRVMLSQPGIEYSLDFTLLPTDWFVGCQLWLRAESITGLNPSDAVEIWSDLTDHRVNLTQAAAVRRPSYQPNSVNGLPAVRFDGLDDYLAHHLEPDAAWSGEFSIFLVVAATTLGQPDHASLFSNARNFGGGDAPETFQIEVNGNNPGQYQFFSTRTVNMGPVTTSYVLLEAILSGARLRTYYNGEPRQQRNMAGREGNSFGDYLLGVNRNGDQYFRGELAELILYSRALADGERVALEQYLGRRFAISLA